MRRLAASAIAATLLAVSSARAEPITPLRFGRERATIFAFDDVAGWQRDRYHESRKTVNEDHVGLFPSHGPGIGIHASSDSGVTAGLVSTVWIRSDDRDVKGLTIRMNLRFGKIFPLSPAFAVWLRAGPSLVLAGAISGRGVAAVDVGAEALLVWLPLRTPYSSFGVTLGPHGNLALLTDQPIFQAFGVGGGVQWAF